MAGHVKYVDVLRRVQEPSWRQWFAAVRVVRGVVAGRRRLRVLPRPVLRVRARVHLRVHLRVRVRVRVRVGFRLPLA